MTEHKHTPGPWYHDDAIGPALGIDRHSKATVGVWAQSRYDAAADMDDEDYDPEDEKWLCGAWGVRSEEDIANAKLIAAAPELLEALEGMLRLADAAGASDRIICCESRKAIAKARGLS